VIIQNTGGFLQAPTNYNDQSKIQNVNKCGNILNINCIVLHQLRKRMNSTTKRKSQLFAIHEMDSIRAIFVKQFNEQLSYKCLCISYCCIKERTVSNYFNVSNELFS